MPENLLSSSAINTVGLPSAIEGKATCNRLVKTILAEIIDPINKSTLLTFSTSPNISFTLFVRVTLFFAKDSQRYLTKIRLSGV